MPDLWKLAQDNADVLRMSTLFVTRDVPKYLADDAIDYSTVDDQEEQVTCPPRASPGWELDLGALCSMEGASRDEQEEVCAGADHRQAA